MNAPKQQVVIAVTRKRREQLEYTIKLKYPSAYLVRTRNGTMYKMPNGSKLYVQVQGNLDVGIDTTLWKAKEWKAWIMDEELEEEDVKNK